MYTHIYLVTLTVFTCFVETNSLRCYNCTSRTDSNCGLTLTNKDSIQKVECDSGQCAKIDANIKIGTHKDEFFTRMCIPLCTEVCSGTQGGTICSFCCTDDLCNAGATLKSLTGTLIIVTIVAILLNVDL